MGLLGLFGGYELLLVVLEWTWFGIRVGWVQWFVVHGCLVCLVVVVISLEVL